jgi:pyruvate formate lyase activating enzyme
METCAHVPWEHLKEALRYLDWIFVDIKHMDPKRHEEGTGVTNELILKNIERMATLERAPRMMVRMPVVPGFNDSDENVTATAEFMKRLGKDEINVLPFHRLGASKYEQLGWDYPYKNVEPPTNEKMLHIKRVFERYGIRCYIGSNTPF